MKPTLCTISFRHHLISLAEIADWAKTHGFQGIELWGVHASNLSESGQYDAEWLRGHGLSVPMVSDYLPVEGDRSAAIHKTKRLCGLAQYWGAKKLRTFAGTRGSSDVPCDERSSWVARMREQAEIARAHGLDLVVETHPNTLADTSASTLRLLEEIDHPALKLNFDVIHVWEAGEDPVHVFGLFEPVVVHMHLKNVAKRSLLSVFAPANVYAPAGDRSGMVELFAGALDFESFLGAVRKQYPVRYRTIDASLEWFGGSVLPTLEGDCRKLAWLDSEASERGRPLPEAPRLGREASSR
jgi:3-dehydroshikimate dehydratase